MSLLLHCRHPSSLHYPRARLADAPLLCAPQVEAHSPGYTRAWIRSASCWLRRLAVKSPTCEPLQTYFYTHVTRESVQRRSVRPMNVLIVLPPPEPQSFNAHPPP